ncbi:MAG: hypothetical protein ACR2QK_10730, partial [Acidimicrobiales bacterium]
TNQFQIAFLGVGPTEIRIGYILINTVLFFTGTALFSWAVPVALIGHVVAIAIVAWRTQLILWQADRAANVDGAEAGARARADEQVKMQPEGHVEHSAGWRSPEASLYR